ncbi:MBL fold metallo-hydrolase [Nakamurella flavida]|uniref:MBL fold metallo-hydrolase n=1 Tax=Nakamurella flavida TaxID=363630 RepID=A0A938YHZ4_9ACTN|nr:MBL fold metallo-hydrolase [Nakamurella flavida]MBM9476272.1 MBL fold metallo-hydrolase [Nakamurella flavida]MDP9779628.1 glyoxylase-like metal-dependent hydrolase (beta-lactamase superfamily II) [Nakamurella flavida]
MSSLRVLDPQVAVLLAPNPGPMTLDGTNSYRLAAPGTAAAVVVDPGPDDTDHLRTLAAAGPVELVLITHRHADHTAGAAAFAAMTGAPVRAVDPVHCLGASPLTADERIDAAGLTITVLATPGHTADSACFRLPGPGSGSVLTGDTILGRGTTVLAPPDGSLADYLRTLDLLAGLGAARVLPAHGPELPDLAAVCRAYRRHREERLAQVRDAVTAASLDPGDPAAVGVVTDRVYGEVDPSVRGAAESSVAAQLRYLAGGGR